MSKRNLHTNACRVRLLILFRQCKGSVTSQCKMIHIYQVGRTIIVTSHFEKTEIIQSFKRLWETR